jgi:hypothetical protein
MDDSDRVVSDRVESATTTTKEKHD